MRGIPWKYLLSLALLISVASVGEAVPVAEPGSPERIALIVSNDVYRNPQQGLPGALRDAELMRKTLTDKRLGFQVTFVRNAGKQQLEQVLRNFKVALQQAGPAAVGFFYYAGHGGSDEAQTDNYLIPGDVQDVYSVDLPRYGISVRKITDDLALLDRKPAIVIVVDACRSSAETVAERGDPQHSRPARGLVTPDEQKPGFLVALSASKAASAPDDGPYARALAKKLLLEGLTVEEVFQLVRHEVSKTTQMRQLPVERSQIVDAVCLVSCAAAEAGPYSRNSVLLDSSRRSAESAMKQLVDLEAESLCKTGWTLLKALHDSAIRALQEGHHDVAGTTFEQVKVRTYEVQAYLQTVRQAKRSLASYAAAEEQRKKNDALTHERMYQDNLIQLNRSLHYLREQAAYDNKKVDTTAIDSVMTVAEKLRAAGELEDANDRLIDGMNLVNEMETQGRPFDRFKRPYMPRVAQEQNYQAEIEEMVARAGHVCR